MALRVLCERYGTYAQNQLHYREYVFLHFFLGSLYVFVLYQY